MRRIGASEARNTLGGLLDPVQQGEEIMIIRHGKAVARLVPADRRPDRKRAIAAVARLRALAEAERDARRANGRKPMTLGDWAGCRDEGRRGEPGSR